MREKLLATSQYLSIRFCPQLRDKFELIIKRSCNNSRMVCSNYDPDPRKNVCKNGMARRVDDNSSIIFSYHLPNY